MSTWLRAAKVSTWRLISLSAWTRPTDPSVYGWLDVDVSRALAYLEGLPASPKITITHLVGKAVAMAIADCPSVNAIIRRDRIYLRDTVDVFFQVAYDQGENLSGLTIESADQKSLGAIANELATRAKTIREHREHALSRSDARLSRVPAPLRAIALRAVETAVYDWNLDLRRFGVPRDAFGCAMITNVGMFGLPHAFAPLVPFTRTPIVVAVGAVREAPVVDHGEIVVRPVLPVGVTLDHRVLDGYQAGKLARRFEEILSDPRVSLGG